MRRRRRANNELPDHLKKRLSKQMMRKNTMTLLECSTAWAFRWFHGMFYCSYCDMKFPDPLPLREHVEIYHMDDLPTTDIFAKLSQNNMVKVDIAKLNCRLCNCKLNNLDSLKEHITLHEKYLFEGYSDGVLPFKLSDEEFECQICFASFLNFPRVNEHMNKHYQNHICDECGKAFISESRFRKHSQSHESGNFPCSLCDLVLPTRVARMCHRQKVHRKGIRYNCPRCPEVFTSYHGRIKHLSEAHQQRKEYDCNVCGKLFDTICKRDCHFKLLHGIQKRSKVL